MLGRGGGVGGAGRQPAEEPFKPRVIKPDPSVKQAREDFQKVLGDKVSFWQEELARLGGSELSASLTEMLERMGILKDE